MIFANRADCATVWTHVARPLARWTIHPVGGVITLLGVLYGMYQFMGVFGKRVNPAIVAFFDQ